MLLATLLQASTTCVSNESAPIDITWLACRANEMVKGCTEPLSPSAASHASGATVAFTPDASQAYGAQWTRDFYYTVRTVAGIPAALPFFPAALNGSSVAASVRFTFTGQRARDGCMPDRVQTDGSPVYSPGGVTTPLADHAWDNGPFAALLLAATAMRWDDSALFCDLEPRARIGLEFVNRSSANGLVWNDEAAPNCTYGFTDTVAKSGGLLFTSLLFHDASLQLAAAARRFGCGDAELYEREARAVIEHVDDLYDERSGLWFAASKANRLPDVWGSAYLVALKLSTPKRRERWAADFESANRSRYVQYGQVRSLPYPLTWERCFGGGGGSSSSSSNSRGDNGARGDGSRLIKSTHCAANGTYQNGAYWATPLPYFVRALLATGRASASTQLVVEAISDFKLRGGIYEDVDDGLPSKSVGVLNYTASATNALFAASLVLTTK